AVLVVGGTVVAGTEVVSSAAEPVPVVICARPTPAVAAKTSPTNAAAIVRRGKRCRPGTGLPSLVDCASTERSPVGLETCGVPRLDQRLSLRRFASRPTRDRGGSGFVVSAIAISNAP